MSKIAKFGCEMLRNVAKCGKYGLAKFENFVYTFVLRAEIATIFGPSVVGMW